MANTITQLAGDRSIVVLPSAARTAAPDSQEFRNLGRAQGLVVVVNATAKSATPSVTVTISGVDVFTGATWTILTSAAITDAGTTVLKVHPGITVASNVAVADVLPQAFRISCAHGDSDSLTYSVSAYLTN